MIVSLPTITNRIGSTLSILALPFRLLALFCAWFAWNLFKLGKHRPKPIANTVEAFETRYRGNLHDVWDTAYHTVCPVDVCVSFKEPGEGSFGTFEGGSEFIWRQTGDFEIEMRRNEEKTWSAVSYRFQVIDDVVHLQLSPEGSAADWVREFAWTCIPLAGTSPPPRGT